MVVSDLYQYAEPSGEEHEYHNPELSFHFVAEEVGEKAAGKFQAPDYQHVDLKPVSIVVNWILDGVVESVVAGLRKTEDYQRNQVLSFEESVFYLLGLVLLVVLHPKLLQRSLTIEPSNVVETLQALLIALVCEKKLRSFHQKEGHQEEQNERHAEYKGADV